MNGSSVPTTVAQPWTCILNTACSQIWTDCRWSRTHSCHSKLRPCSFTKRSRKHCFVERHSRDRSSKFTLS